MAATGIDATASIVLDGGIGTIPGAMVMSGKYEVFHLAVCRDCGNMVLPFFTAQERDDWAGEHPHETKSGIEVQRRV